MTNATVEPKIGAEVRDLELAICHPNPWNKTREVDAAFVQSIREKGQVVIATVRPHPEREGEFEIITGARRHAALQAIGHPTLMAEIREMDDEEAEELCAAENAHRAGLSWQQQCELISSFLERHQDEDAAARIGSALGITTAQVKRRAKMLSLLSPSWNAAIIDGALPAWTADHFEVVAVFDEKFQEALYKRLEYSAGGMTLSDLKEEIAEESTVLKSAPWDLDDVTLLPKVGACEGCPTRSDAQSDLFGGTTLGKKDADAHCLNGECFGKKMQAFAKRKEAALLEKHPEAVKVAEGYGKGPKNALRSHEVTTAKKGDKGAVPAIQYGQGGKVTLAYVKVKKSAQPPTEKDKAKEEAKKRDARITALAIEKLIAIVEDPNTEFTDEAEAVLLQYCLIYGAELNIDDDLQEKRVRAFAKKPITVEELWESAAVEMVRSLNREKWNCESGYGREGSQETLDLVAWMVSADFPQLLKEAEEEISTAPAPSEEGAVPGTVDTGDMAEDGDDLVD